MALIIYDCICMIYIILPFNLSAAHQMMIFDLFFIKSKIMILHTHTSIFVLLKVSL